MTVEPIEARSLEEKAGESGIQLAKSMTRQCEKWINNFPAASREQKAAIQILTARMLLDAMGVM